VIWPPAPNPIQLSGFDESKHPRDDDGKFGEGASVKDVAGAIAQDLGLELDLSPIKGEDAFILRKIVVPESERGKGSGSKAMEQLLAWADKTGQTVGLTPDPAYGGNKKRLIEFYGRFGFKPNKGRKKDYRFQESMVRDADFLKDCPKPEDVEE